MKLFHHLLLSLLPNEFVRQHISPGSIFVSFISPKQFFNVIHRRVNEHYKINLFDINRDSFEAKIGFGNNALYHTKDIDSYFAYNVAANLNGRNFYAPMNLATMMSIVMCVSTYNTFQSFSRKYFSSFANTISFLVSLFVSRIKIFPGEMQEEEQYKWFVDLFFSTYRFFLKDIGIKEYKKQYNDLKNRLLRDIHLFFALFYFYKKVNVLLLPSFDDENVDDILFYKRFFGVKEGGKNRGKNNLIDKILASRISEKLEDSLSVFKGSIPLYNWMGIHIFTKDIFVFTRYLFRLFFDEDTLHKLLYQCLKGEEYIQPLLLYIMDWSHLKKSYYRGMKALSFHLFHTKGKQDLSDHYALELFISSLEGGAKENNIPQGVLQESILMDQLLNFYVSYLGGSWIARGDTFWLRMMHHKLIGRFMGQCLLCPSKRKQTSLHFFGTVLYLYQKNTFYYNYVHEKLKEGKNVFEIPLHNTFPSCFDSDEFLVKMIFEGLLLSFLQDINKKSVKIYMRDKKILKFFQETFAYKIGSCVRKSKEALRQDIYPVFLLMNGSQYNVLMNSMCDVFGDAEEMIVRENLYSMDMQIWIYMTTRLCQNEILKDSYDIMTLIGIFAILRETLFGFLLRYVYCEDRFQKHKKQFDEHAVQSIYFCDIVGVNKEYKSIFYDVFFDILKRFRNLMKIWVNLDENAKYCFVGVKSIFGLIEDQETGGLLLDGIAGEDLVRFMGYLRSINYYNKRYLIPNSVQ